MLFCKPQHGAIDGEAESRDQSPTSRASGQNRVEPGPERNQRPHPPPHRDRPRIWLDQPIEHLQQRGLTSPVMPDQPQALMPSPPGVRHLGCTKAFLRNLFFGPSQGPQFPAAQFKRHILDGEEFARTETVRGVEGRASRGECVWEGIRGVEGRETRVEGVG